MIIAIDPGATGAIAWMRDGETAGLQKMPETQQEILSQLEHLLVTAGAESVMCYLEDVGYHMPGNSATATAKFARHCGHLEAFLLALGISAEPVRPQKWMKSMGVLPKDKAARKKAIRERMQQRYPYLNIPLWGSDAVGILDWAIRKH